MKISGLAAALAVLLAGGTAAAQADPEAAMAAAGKQVFHRCQECHSLDRSMNAFGPTLYGVVGRSAGTVPRFDYSDALKGSGLVWSEDNLRRWIAGNEILVPGTRMRHVSITDPAEQDYLIAFIKTLK